MCFFLQTSCGTHETILNVNVWFFVGEGPAGRGADHLSASHVETIHRAISVFMGCNCEREHLFIFTFLRLWKLCQNRLVKINQNFEVARNFHLRDR
jgi:hypothetical protein